VVPPTWCYCSAGFEKTLFDNVFGESLEVEVKQSVLDGSQRCRFAIKLTESVGGKKPLE
jgi:predicted hydrocarbon binding protein